MNHELEAYWKLWWEHSKVIIYSVLLTAVPSMFFNHAVVIGSVAGGIVAFLNFRLIALQVQQVVDMAPEQARIYAFTRYLVRFVLVFLLFAILLLRKDLGVSALVGAIPPFFAIKLWLFLKTFIGHLMSYTKKKKE
ncbi:hypothetical protein SDC9_150569 [bioreactor metagenome]|uniref:ATP synthase I chain n=1 Tax=bioreactor metagenome TaxID=1076179 RepID=A0A645EPZ6_9ZZZZ